MAERVIDRLTTQIRFRVDESSLADIDKTLKSLKRRLRAVKVDVQLDVTRPEVAALAAKIARYLPRIPVKLDIPKTPAVGIGRKPSRGAPRADRQPVEREPARPSVVVGGPARDERGRFMRRERPAQPVVEQPAAPQPAPIVQPEPAKPVRQRRVRAEPAAPQPAPTPFVEPETPAPKPVVTRKRPRKVSPEPVAAPPVIEPEPTPARPKRDARGRFIKAAGVPVTGVAGFGERTGALNITAGQRRIGFDITDQTVGSITPPVPPTPSRRRASTATAAPEAPIAQSFTITKEAKKALKEKVKALKLTGYIRNFVLTKEGNDVLREKLKSLKLVADIDSFNVTTMAIGSLKRQMAMLSLDATVGGVVGGKPARGTRAAGPTGTNTVISPFSAPGTATAGDTRTLAQTPSQRTRRRGVLPGTAGQVGAAAHGSLGLFGLGMIYRQIMRPAQLAMQERRAQQASMARISTFLDVPMEEVRQYQQQAIEMAPRVGVAPSRILQEGFYTAISRARYLSPEQRISLAETAALGELVGLGDTGDIAGLLTSIRNAYRGSRTATADMSDQQILESVLFAVQRGGFEAGVFTKEIGKIIPIAAGLDEEFASTAMMLGLLGRTGTRPSQAATQLRRLQLAFVKPTRAGKKELKAALKGTGIEYDQLRGAVAEEGVFGAVGHIVDTLGEGDPTKTSVFFRNIRELMPTLDIFGNARDDNEKIMADLQKAMKEMRSGDPARIFAASIEAISRTIEGRERQTEAQALTAGGRVGEIMEPIWVGLLALMKRVGATFLKLPSPVQTGLVVGAGAVIASVGAALAASFAALLFRVAKASPATGALKGLLLGGPARQRLRRMRRARGGRAGILDWFDEDYVPDKKRRNARRRARASALRRTFRSGFLYRRGGMAKYNAMDALHRFMSPQRPSNIGTTYRTMSERGAGPIVSWWSRKSQEASRRDTMDAARRMRPRARRAPAGRQAGFLNLSGFTRASRRGVGKALGARMIGRAVGGVLGSFLGPIGTIAGGILIGEGIGLVMDNWKSIVNSFASALKLFKDMIMRVLSWFGIKPTGADRDTKSGGSTMEEPIGLASAKPANQFGEMVRMAAREPTVGPTSAQLRKMEHEASISMAAAATNPPKALHVDKVEINVANWDERDIAATANRQINHLLETLDRGMASSQVA